MMGADWEAYLQREGERERWDRGGERESVRDGFRDGGVDRWRWGGGMGRRKE